jgi:RimJ/RimL family protein N-acetyltransferase
MREPLAGVRVLRLLGVILIAAGTIAVIDCFARFALQGRGTPAPVAPTRTLVVTGLYRYERNPMYVAVLCVIVGQALLLGSVQLLQYAGFTWLFFFVFVLAYEQPTLHRQFGESYRVYQSHVRGWWPRLRPWQAGKNPRSGDPAFQSAVSREAPLVLEGERVKLLPLSLEHEAALNRAAADGELWKLFYTFVPAADGMRAYIEKALQAAEAGTQYPFVIVDRTDGRVVGSTRYMNIDVQNRKREIGSTWLARSAQRTAINTETKFLLLRHAFETLGCLRVGILRKHMVMPGGRHRDSVCFSIIDTEWPGVRASLLARLGQSSSREE